MNPLVPFSVGLCLLIATCGLGLVGARSLRGLAFAFTLTSSLAFALAVSAYEARVKPGRGYRILVRVLSRGWMRYAAFSALLSAAVFIASMPVSACILGPDVNPYELVYSVELPVYELALEVPGTLIVMEALLLAFLLRPVKPSETRVTLAIALPPLWYLLIFSAALATSLPLSDIQRFTLQLLELLTVSTLLASAATTVFALLLERAISLFEEHLQPVATVKLQ